MAKAGLVEVFDRQPLGQAFDRDGDVGVATRGAGRSRARHRGTLTRVRRLSRLGT